MNFSSLRAPLGFSWRGILEWNMPFVVAIGLIVWGIIDFAEDGRRQAWESCRSEIIQMAGESMGGRTTAVPPGAIAPAAVRTTGRCPGFNDQDLVALLGTLPNKFPKDLMPDSPMPGDPR